MGEHSLLLDTFETPVALLLLSQTYTQLADGGGDPNTTERVYIFLME